MENPNNNLISPANKFLLEKGVDCENYIIIDATGHYKGQIPIATWLEEFSQLEKLKKNEKLTHQLFIGKVADLIGFDKTTQLLKELMNLKT